MKALIDGDVLVYEIGFGAETGWAGEDLPSWDYVAKLFDLRELSRIRENHASKAVMAGL